MTELTHEGLIEAHKDANPDLDLNPERRLEIFRRVIGSETPELPHTLDLSALLQDLDEEGFSIVQTEGLEGRRDLAELISQREIDPLNAEVMDQQVATLQGAVKTWLEKIERQRVRINNLVAYRWALQWYDALPDGPFDEFQLPDGVKANAIASERSFIVIQGMPLGAVEELSLEETDGNDSERSTFRGDMVISYKNGEKKTIELTTTMHGGEIFNTVQNPNEGEEPIPCKFIDSGTVGYAIRNQAMNF